MINLNKITEAKLVVKAEAMNQMHLLSGFVVASVLFFVLFLIRQRLSD